MTPTAPAHNSVPAPVLASQVTHLAGQVAAPLADSLADSLTGQRIDPSVAGPIRDAGSEVHRVDSSHTSRAAPDEADEPSFAESMGREIWLALHAKDLIARLQTWATDLDAREANLNAAYARQELRERQFRLYQHEVEAQMAEHNRVARELRERMREHARRLAFTGL